MSWQEEAIAELQRIAQELTVDLRIAQEENKTLVLLIRAITGKEPPTVIPPKKIDSAR